MNLGGIKREKESFLFIKTNKILKKTFLNFDWKKMVLSKGELESELKRFYKDRNYIRAYILLKKSNKPNVQNFIENSSLAQMILGEMYLFGYGIVNDHEKAKIHLENAYQKNPKDCMILYLYAMLFKNKDEEKYKIFLKLSAEKECPEALLEVATYNMNKNTGYSLKIINSLIALKFLPAEIKLAEIHMLNKKYQEAKEILKKITKGKLTFESYKGFILYGDLVGFENDIELQLKIYLEVLQFLSKENLHEDQPLLNEKIGMIYYKKNQIFEAQKYLSKSIQNKDVSYYLGVIEYRSGSMQKAKTFLEKSHQMGNTKALGFLKMNKLLDQPELDQVDINQKKYDNYDIIIHNYTKKKLFKSLTQLGALLYEKKDPRAFGIFLTSNKNDELLSNFYLGKIFLKDQNYKKAIMHFERFYQELKQSNDEIIISKNEETIFQLGLSYFFEKEFAKTHELYHPLIGISKNPTIFEILGILQSYKFVPPTEESPPYYFKRAIWLNSKRAYNFLADYYYFSKNDIILAKESLDPLSIDEMNVQSLYILGMFYKESDIQKSKEYFEKVLTYKDYPNTSDPFSPVGTLFFYSGFSKGLVHTLPFYESFYQLALIFKKEGNIKESIIYFTLASEAGYSQAMYELGMIYLYEDEGKEDKNLSEELFIKAEQLGVHDAGNQLYNIYKFGLLGKNDPKRAELYSKYIIKKIVEKKIEKIDLKYFENHLNEGDTKLLFELGVIFYEGRETEKNLGKALEFMKKSVEYNPSIVYQYIGMIFLDLKDYNSAKESFEKSQSSESFVQLGNMYLNGLGVELDYKKAMEFYEEALSLGNKNVKMILGNLYTKGIGVPIDHKKAYKYYSSIPLNEALSLFDGESLNLYGELCLELGKFENAKTLFEYAIDKDEKLAYNNLGSIYFNGLGIYINYIKARELYESNIENLNSESLNNLVKIYFEGLGGIVDYYKARVLMEKSLNLLNQENIMKLSNMFLQGLGGPKNIHLAQNIIKNGVKEDNLNIYLMLGKFNFLGIDGIKDWNKAKIELEKAESVLDRDGLYMLGVIYFHESDYIKSKLYFEKSLEFAKVESLYYLGMIYFRGLNVERDYKKAKIYFEKNVLVKTEFINECYNILGKIYLFGLDVPKNYFKAISYFKKDTSELSNTDLGYCYFFGLGVEKNEREATFYFSTSDSSSDLNNLGYISLINKNDQLAKELFEKAIKKGNNYSLINLAYIQLLSEKIEISKSLMDMIDEEDLNEIHYLTNFSVLNDNNMIKLFEKSFKGLENDINLIKNEISEEMNQQKMKEKSFNISHVRYNHILNQKFISALLRKIKL